MSSVEQDFRNALKQILEDMSGQHHNAWRSAEFSFSRIARKASHSRTLISKEQCAYPRVRELILRVQRRVNGCGQRKVRLSHEGGGEKLQGQSLVEANTRLRTRVKELTAEVQMFATLLAEADQQLRIYRKGDTRAEHDRERRSKRDEKSG